MIHQEDKQAHQFDNYALRDQVCSQRNKNLSEDHIALLDLYKSILVHTPIQNSAYCTLR